MARITVEDCLDKVDNRFELVMVASKRARQIQTGGKDPMLSVDNDKPTVLALREVADGLVDAKILIEKPSVDLEEEFSGSADSETSESEGSEVEAAADGEAAEAGEAEPTAEAEQEEADK